MKKNQDLVAYRAHLLVPFAKKWNKLQNAKSSDIEFEVRVISLAIWKLQWTTFLINWTL